MYDADLKLDDAVQELEIEDVAREHQMDEELVEKILTLMKTWMRE